MADGTHIEWTDATANVVNGCSVLSPGCTNCYAMRLAGTRLKHHPSRAGLTTDTKAGPVWSGKTKFHEAALVQVLRWRRPRMIFWNAHGDLFHESVPNEWIDRCFAGMALTPQHKHQVLTKRTERMREWATDPATPSRMWRSVDALIDDWDEGKIKCRLRVLDGDPKLAALAAHGAAWGGELPWPLKNVWLGTSVEDQKRAEERIPILLDTPAAVRWISAEPLLGPLDLTSIELDGDSEMDALKPRQWEDEIADWRGSSYTWEEDFEDWYGRKIGCCSGQMHPTLDWIVVGGESGPGSRPMHPDWLVGLHDQCIAADVPFLFKQWGDHTADQIGPEDAHSLRRMIGDVTFTRVGKKAAGRKLFGVEHNGYPA
jgi:protein gp37